MVPSNVPEIPDRLTRHHTVKWQLGINIHTWVYLCVFNLRRYNKCSQFTSYLTPRTPTKLNSILTFSETYKKVGFLVSLDIWVEFHHYSAWKLHEQVRNPPLYLTQGLSQCPVYLNHLLPQQLIPHTYRAEDYNSSLFSPAEKITVHCHLTYPADNFSSL